MGIFASHIRDRLLESFPPSIIYTLANLRLSDEGA